MRIKVVRAEKEGFLSGVGIKLPGGTILVTHTDLCWCGTKESDRQQAEFIDFLDHLDSLGVEVER